MERLKHIKETLMSCVESELSNLAQADGKELGEAIDMIKDIEESIYYCTITKAMEDQEKEGKKKDDEKRYYDNGRRGMMMPYPMANEMRYYDGYAYYDPYRDIDRMNGRMYYNGNSSSGNNSGSRGGNSGGNNARGGGTRGYEDEYYFPYDMRDDREGRSPMTRKSYMQGKEMHHGKEHQMKELEKYMQELTTDMTEMIKGASPEEKQLLQKKIATLAEKVGQVNV